MTQILEDVDKEDENSGWRNITTMCPQMAEAFYVSFLILAVEIPFYKQHRGGGTSGCWCGLFTETFVPLQIHP